MTAPVLILSTVCAVAVYFFLCSRIAIAIQPIRLAIASIGEELLQSNRLPKSEAARLESEMSRIYSSRDMWLFLVLLPVAAIVVFINECRGTEIATHKIPTDLRAKYSRLRRYIWISRMASSPLAATMFLPVSLTCAIFITAFSPRKAVREIMETSRKTDEMVSGVDERLVKAA